MVDRDATDPPGCWRVIYPCLKHVTGEPEVIYYDGSGRQIDIDGNVITKSE